MLEAAIGKVEHVLVEALSMLEQVTAVLT